MKTKSICSAFFSVVAIFLTVAAFTGCGKRGGNADHSLREDNAAFEAKDGENTEELSGKGDAAFEAKDLEIAAVQLEQYSGSIKPTQPNVRTQSVSIANSPTKRLTYTAIPSRTTKKRSCGSTSMSNWKKMQRRCFRSL